MSYRITRRGINAGIGAALISPALGRTPALAQGAAPIKIGFSMALTGPLAPNGKQALLGAQIWAEQVNAKGGLLGRQVQLVNYDDQSNPSTVPGIYTKLLDVDKCDLIVSGYATNMVAPAIPVVMQRGKVFIGLFALDANGEFHYPKYFSMLPSGPTPRESFTEGFFQVAAAQNPKPQTIAIAAEDADFSHNAAEGARNNVKKYGFKSVYDKTYPPNTTDFSPIIRAIQASQSGSGRVLLLSAELGRPAAIRQRTWIQAEDDGRRHGRTAGDGLQGQAEIAPKRRRELRNLGAVAKTDGARGGLLQDLPIARTGPGIDPLGYYLGGWGYAYFQVLQQAIEGTKSINDDKLADYMRSHAFNTIMAQGIKFGKNGEWTKSAMLQVQYHGITDAANLETWRGMSYQTVVTPADEATGKVIYPYEKALG